MKGKKMIRPGVLLLSLFLCTTSGVPPLSAAQVSVAVQENIDRLIKTNSCPGCDLTGADLNRLNLSGADLRNADLSEATFFLADLAQANLSGAILRGTQFGGADLAQADLRGADLRGALLTGAYTVGSLMDGTLLDRELLDREADVNIHEKVFVPNDETSKHVPDTQEVSIAKRRDFAPVPPVIDQQNLQEGDGAQGPSALVAEQHAPAIKSVEPVSTITISEAAGQTVAAQADQEAEPADTKQQHTASEAVAASVELVASAGVKVSEETDYRELTDTKKTEMVEKPVPDAPPVEERAATEAPEEGSRVEPGPAVGKDEQTGDVSLAAADKVEIDPESHGENGVIEETDLIVDEGAVENTVPVTMPDQLASAEPDRTEGKRALSEKVNDKETGQAETDVLRASDTPRQPAPAGMDEAPRPGGLAAADASPEKPETAVDEAQENAMADSPGVPADVVALNVSKLLETDRCLGCNLAGADLSGKDLDEADLERADLSGALLVDSDLREANLKGVVFRNADLKNADLREADLYKADFSGADLTGAKLDGAQLDDASFAGAVGYIPELMTDQ